MRSKLLLTGLVLALSMPMAEAGPIYSQSLLDDGTSLGTFSSLSGGSQVADNFSLDQEYSITGLAWWGSYYDFDTGDSFTVRLLSDDGGQPTENADILDSNSLDVSRTAETGVTDDFGQQIYRYDVSLSLMLGSGDFYLSVMNDADDMWFWADAASGDLTNWFRVGATDPWTDEFSGYDLAFVLSGEQVIADVPEPASWVLMLLGLSGLVFRQRGRCPPSISSACHG
ncbi:MAG: PEP-CTERM sorting domain-containing protein [Marinobacter sp.]